MERASRRQAKCTIPHGILGELWEAISLRELRKPSILDLFFRAVSKDELSEPIYLDSDCRCIGNEDINVARLY